MAKIVEYLEPIKLVYTTDCTEARVGLDFIVGSVSELVEINPVVFDEEPSAADLNDLDEEYKLAVKETGTYILCIDSEHYGKSAACLGLDLTPCYISKYTELSIRYTKNTGSTANLSNGIRYPYLCVYKVASDEKGLRLARCGDLTARPDFNFAEKYFNSEMMKPGEYVEFDTDTTEEVNKCKIKGSWLLNEDLVFPEKKITQNVNFTTNQTLTNSDGASSNKFVRMQIGPEGSARVQFDYWESITDVFFFEVHNVSWLVSEFDRILHYGDTEQWVSQEYYDFVTTNGKEITDDEGGEGEGEETPDTPDPDIPTGENLEAIVQSIIDKANEVTGKADTDLTKCINSLIEVYGQGGSGGTTAPIEGTAIPVGEAVERIYFNTNLSVEEVNNYLSQLTYVQTPLSEYPIYAIFVNPRNYLFVAKTNVARYNLVYTDSLTADFTVIYDNVSTDGKKGWTGREYWYVDDNNEQTVTSELVYCQLKFFNVASLSDFNGIPVGAENEKIKNVLSITPFGSTGGGSVPVWDGTLSFLITFTLDGETYYAEEGMTWADWVASDYNTVGAYVDGVQINGGTLNGQIQDPATPSFVLNTDIIQGGYAYGLYTSGGSPMPV